MSRLNKIFKSKTGFTLVELCIVMAVTAVVASLVVMFMVFATKQKNDLTAEASYVDEIMQVQKSVNEWIKKYDSENFTITTTDNTNLIASNSTEEVGRISFTGEKKINADGEDKTERLTDIVSVTFTPFNEVIEEITITKAVKVTIHYGDNKSQDLVFSMYSKKTRNRRVENRS